MSDPIPFKSRKQVRGRERDRCMRCAGAGTDWHHRRGRAVGDAHTHCPCNGAWLCRTCHDWAHQHPAKARELGFIVSRHVANPSAVPIKTYYGLIVLSCSGGFSYTQQESEA